MLFQDRKKGVMALPFVAKAVSLHVMRYADVILPLPLEGLFTYSVPPSLEGAVRFGMRVVVPFGRSKTYMGVVARVHDVAPEGYDVKPVAQVPDKDEVVTEGQYRLWQWIADYYMSPIGEVMKAALPSGLKAEEGWRPRTELYVRLTPPYRTCLLYTSPSPRDS